jgi:uncharacterized protein (DUF433 family)
LNLPDFLTSDRYGFVHFNGHRVGLRHVIDLYNDGYTPEMLHDHFPTLTLALVHKAIAFYLDHTADVDAQIQHSNEQLKRQAAAAPPRPDAAELKRRMAARQPRESA